jgi:hypothetical protein
MAHPALSEEDPIERRVEVLEQRLEELERPDDGRAPEPAMAAAELEQAASWMERFHLSGNADVNYLYGEKNSLAKKGRFAVENARFFLDVDVAEESTAWDRVLIGATSFYFEWDLARAAELKNGVGSLYVRFDGIFDQPALNAKFGRMPLPFGEEYLRFHEQRPENPLISFSTAAPYGWDEGLLVFGALAKGRLQYMLALTDGDASYAMTSAGEPAVTGKLVLDPTSWLNLSLSGHRSGPLGPTDASFAMSALEIGGYELYPNVIPTTASATFQNGVVIPPDPSRKLDDVYAFEGDVILRSPRFGQLWLSYGRVFVEAASNSVYDADLQYWTAEGILELGSIADALDPLYLALRYSAIGTFDSDKGWRLRVMNEGANLGFNVDRVHAISAGIGLRLGEHVVLKAEYSWFDFQLVRGVTAALESLAGSRDYGGIGFTLAF